MRGALSALSLMLAAGGLCLEARAAQAPAATQAANPEAVLRRFAGVWKEDVDNRKSGAFSLLLRFRRSAAGGLEELRGPEDRPQIRPVIPDGGLRPIPGSKNSIRWKQTDANRFEEELLGPGRKLLSTRRLVLSADGRTLTERSESAGGSWTAVYRRTDEEGRGLAGNWSRESVQDTPRRMSFEPAGAGAVKVSAENPRGTSTWTVTLGGEPAPATGNFANTKVAARQLDEHSMELFHSRDGSVFLKTTLRISPDGKTMTVSGVSVGPDGPRGEPTVAVYQKQ